MKSRGELLGFISVIFNFKQETRIGEMRLGDRLVTMQKSFVGINGKLSKINFHLEERRQTRRTDEIDHQTLPRDGSKACCAPV